MSAKSRSVTVLACGALAAAGVGIAVFFWRRRRSHPPRGSAPRSPRAAISRESEIPPVEDESHPTKDDLEKAAQRHFEGVGGAMFEDDEEDEEEEEDEEDHEEEDEDDEEEDEDEDEEFLDGEEAIINFLETEEAKAEEDNLFQIPAGTDFSSVDDDDGFGGDDDDYFGDDVFGDGDSGSGSGSDSGSDSGNDSGSDSDNDTDSDSGSDSGGDSDKDSGSDKDEDKDTDKDKDNDDGSGSNKDRDNDSGSDKDNDHV